MPSDRNSRAWVPFFIGDHVKDTGHLSTLEEGAYLRLMFHYYSTGKPLPASDRILANIARVPLTEWAEIRDVVVALFVRDGEVLRHKRIEHELAGIARRSAQGREKAAKRWQRNQEGDAVAMPQHPDSTAAVIPQHSSGNAGEMLVTVTTTTTAQGVGESSIEASPTPLAEEEAAERSAGAAAPPPSAVLEFPCTGGVGARWGLTEAKLDEYRTSFPGLDVLGELRKARQWLLDNPTRQKTLRGVPAFLGRWLAREVDSPRRAPAVGGRERSGSGSLFTGGSKARPAREDPELQRVAVGGPVNKEAGR